VDTIEIRDRQRFQQFIRELMAGRVGQSPYQPWEIVLIVDFSRCRVGAKGRKPLLQRYELAVLRDILNGQVLVPMISSFLAEERRARIRKPRLELQSAA
jgi:hypothetical protein